MEAKRELYTISFTYLLFLVTKSIKCIKSTAHGCSTSQNANVRHYREPLENPSMSSNEENSQNAPSFLKKVLRKLTFVFSVRALALRIFYKLTKMQDKYSYIRVLTKRFLSRRK